LLRPAARDIFPAKGKRDDVNRDRQREALIKLDLPTMVKMGAHPLAPFLAQLQIERLRPKSAKHTSKDGGR
jgi:hypothetical protein